MKTVKIFLMKIPLYIVVMKKRKKRKKFCVLIVVIICNGAKPYSVITINLQMKFQNWLIILNTPIMCIPIVLWHKEIVLESQNSPSNHSHFLNTQI